MQLFGDRTQDDRRNFRCHVNICMSTICDCYLVVVFACINLRLNTRISGIYYDCFRNKEVNYSSLFKNSETDVLM
jgi:hypothetical protein